MIEFVKGQWYQNKNTKQYFQCMTDATRGNNYLRLRLAGSESCFLKDHMDITVYAPASLTPDFSNVNVGDECFSPILSHCQIANIDGNWELYGDTNRFDVSEIYVKQKHTNNYMYYYPPRRGHHPSLYNSFAQFQAYWAEQALLMATQRRNHE
jgi:hypothetical protein